VLRFDDKLCMRLRRGRHRRGRPGV